MAAQVAAAAHCEGGMTERKLFASAARPGQRRGAMIRTLVFTLFALSTHAADWPQFRGPTGDGKATVKNLPLKWGPDQNIAWRAEIPGSGWSSPVLADGKVYLTTAVVTKGSEASPKADRSLRALCLDAAGGKVLWDVEVFKQEGAKAPDSIHRKNGHASPTPIVAEGRLYVHFGHQGTACLDLTGKKLWENRSFFYQPQHGNGGSPVLVDGNLIFSCDGREEQFILALKASNGAKAWKFPRPTEASKKFAFATAAVFTIGGKKQVISPGADMVNALDPATGKEFWRATYEGYSNVPMPAYGDGLVFVSSAFDTPEVLAIDPNGGGDVTDTHVKWIETKYAPKTPSMIFDNGLLYMVTDSGIVACREGKSGTLLWESERILRDCSASPVLCEGKIYALDEFGKCAILAAGREYKLLGTNEFPDEKTLASIAVDDGTIYLRGEKTLYCIREKP
jgi:outer membrane protein assembly factor BamB